MKKLLKFLDKCFALFILASAYLIYGSVLLVPFALVLYLAVILLGLIICTARDVFVLVLFFFGVDFSYHSWFMYLFEGIGYPILYAVRLVEAAFPFIIVVTGIFILFTLIMPLFSDKQEYKDACSSLLVSIFVIILLTVIKLGLTFLFT